MWLGKVNWLDLPKWLVLAFVISGFAAKTNAQQGHPREYEDDQVKIVIPSGWSLSLPSNQAIPKTDLPSIAEIPDPANGVFLEKDGYILTLAYVTSHASGIRGGRIIEVFRVPWIDDPFEGESCVGLLRRTPQRADETLQFVSLILDPLNAEVRLKCRVPKALGRKVYGTKGLATVTEQRWFAGYFTTPPPSQPLFFESDGAECGEKVYTLSSGAMSPSELPTVNDPVLNKIIGESIRIVGSTKYKRCPPASVKP
jgi:hypothetical protein